MKHGQCKLFMSAIASAILAVASVSNARADGGYLSYAVGGDIYHRDARQSSTGAVRGTVGIGYHRSGWNGELRLAGSDPLFGFIDCYGSECDGLERISSYTMHTAHVRKTFVHFELPHNLKISSRAGIAFGHAIADGGVHSNASGFGGEISWGGELNFKYVALTFDYSLGRYWLHREGVAGPDTAKQTSQTAISADIEFRSIMLGVQFGWGM
jgi:hypothetical protein